mmetsp:Transcript_12902/g.12794  ORF Transcript_12902/g.12794 Transcript_12902/m.12794 type:complete len:213 (+) Transcript_12902:34-672(+)
MIKQKQFEENSVSVGEGEDNASVMPDGFRERHDLEQYFFTKNAIDKLISALLLAYPEKKEIEEKVCLICAPTLGKALFEQEGLTVRTLDIDQRFKTAEVPGFQYFDILDPKLVSESIELVLMDPPFFYITLEQLCKSIVVATGGRPNLKVLVSFMIRDEMKVKSSFEKVGGYHLERTNFELEYATVKANRWDNYALYSNVDLPMIKRVKKKK